MPHAQDALRQHFKSRLGPNVAWGGRRVITAVI